MDGDSALCGIDGKDTDPPTRHEVNTFIRRAMYYHVRPAKKELNSLGAKIQTMDETMASHIRADEAIHNQIRGAKIMLWFIGGAFIAIIPLAFKILEALKILLGK